MIVPGLFSFKPKGSQKKAYHWAITRLYVSLDESVCNGVGLLSLCFLCYQC